MKSYFAYMGSKSSVAEKLVAMMPAEASRSFIELFAGAANVFFAKDKARVSILNDLDRDVMDIHTAVALDPNAVMAELKRLPVSRSFYEGIRVARESSRWHGFSQVERSARMIYLFGCAYNANPRSPFVASPMTPLTFGRERDLRPYAAKLRAATLESLDWSRFLDRYIMEQKKLRCLLFADPPYVVTARADHYRHRFGYLDHILLAHKLTRINGLNGGERSVKILVTYDDDKTGLIRALYREEHGWHLAPLPVRYSAGRHAEKTNELLISNFPIKGEI